MNTFGRLDVLVTAAAVWDRRPLEEMTAADVRREFDINALGTFLCCQQAGRIMAGQPQGGAIVTIGDWACARPYANYAAYFLSKGAIPTLTRALAVELAQRNRAVRVNCILPGPVMLPEIFPTPEVKGAVAGTLLKRARPAGERRPGGRVSGRERLRHRGLPAGGRRPDDRDLEQSSRRRRVAEERGNRRCREGRVFQPNNSLVQSIPSCPASLLRVPASLRESCLYSIRGVVGGNVRGSGHPIAAGSRGLSFRYPPSDRIAFF